MTCFFLFQSLCFSVFAFCAQTSEKNSWNKKQCDVHILFNRFQLFTCGMRRGKIRTLICIR